MIFQDAVVFPWLSWLILDAPFQSHLSIRESNNIIVRWWLKDCSLSKVISHWMTLQKVRNLTTQLFKQFKWFPGMLLMWEVTIYWLKVSLSLEFKLSVLSLETWIFNWALIHFVVILKVYVFMWQWWRLFLLFLLTFIGKLQTFIHWDIFNIKFYLLFIC